MALKDIENDIKSLSQKGLEVVKDENLSPAEKRETLDKLEADVKAKIEERDNIKRFEEQREEFLKNAEIDTPNEEREEGKSFGEQFVSSDAYKRLISSGTMKQQNWTSAATELKATMSQTASPIAQPQMQPGVTLLFTQPPRVADLMPSGTTNSNTVRYVKETTATNAADTVAEAAAKPESTLVLAQVDEPVRKIATILPVTDEMLEDEEQIRSYIDQRLRLFVQEAEDDQLLNGTGVAPDLTGILNRSGLQAAVALGVSPDTRVEAIYRQITQIRTNAFLEPDGVVLNPADWQDIRLAKDANGQYYGPGPFAQDGDLRLWGLNVVQTTRIAAGTALVGSFRSASQLFRKGGITVDATNSHASYFASNITTLRAEERVALAVYRPGAFGTVTGL